MAMATTNYHAHMNAGSVPSTKKACEIQFAIGGLGWLGWLGLCVDVGWAGLGLGSNCRGFGCQVSLIFRWGSRTD